MRVALDTSVYAKLLCSNLWWSITKSFLINHFWGCPFTWLQCGHLFLLQGKYPLLSELAKRTFQLKRPPLRRLPRRPPSQKWWGKNVLWLISVNGNKICVHLWEWLLINSSSPPTFLYCKWQQVAIPEDKASDALQLSCSMTDTANSRQQKEIFMG